MAEIDTEFTNDTNQLIHPAKSSCRIPGHQYQYAMALGQTTG